MLSKLLTTADGKIPFLQIIVGVILGAIGMFVYAKFWKPKILYEDFSLSSLSIPSVSIGKDKVQNIQPPQQQTEQPVITTIETTTISPPSFIDLQQINPMQMPTLPTLYEQEEYSNESEDEDEDEVTDNDVEAIQQ